MPLYSLINKRHTYMQINEGMFMYGAINLEIAESNVAHMLLGSQLFCFVFQLI